MDLRSNNNRTSHVPAQIIPSSDEAVVNYEQLGGKITRFPVFGIDPLATNSQLQHEREQRFNDNMNLELIYGKLVNRQDAPFCTAVMKYLNITTELFN